MLTIPDGPFDAYLFDCDGTIADSMVLHHEAWNRALRPHGAHFPEDLFYAWSGMPVPLTISRLNDLHGLRMPIDAVTRAREEAYFELMPGIAAIPEVLAHIHAQHGKIPLAVVSGSPRESVLKTLTYLGLLDRFDAIVGAEDAARGKPHPDPFLEAARLLGVEPTRCLVFEDADFGIQAAEAAGMKWVRVPGPRERR